MKRALSTLSDDFAGSHHDDEPPPKLQPQQVACFQRFINASAFFFVRPRVAAKTPAKKLCTVTS